MAQLVRAPQVRAGDPGNPGPGENFSLKLRTIRSSKYIQNYREIIGKTLKTKTRKEKQIKLKVISVPTLI